MERGTKSNQLWVSSKVKNQTLYNRQCHIFCGNLCSNTGQYQYTESYISLMQLHVQSLLNRLFKIISKHYQDAFYQFTGGKLAIECPENDALFSCLMLAQGVISMIEGVMIFCSIGRAHSYSLFRSGLPTFQYAFVTYALTAFFYIIALTLSGLQVKGL